MGEVYSRGGCGKRKIAELWLAEWPVGDYDFRHQSLQPHTAIRHIARKVKTRAITGHEKNEGTTFGSNSCLDRSQLRGVRAGSVASKVIPNSIWVGADGKFESDPDTALVQFGISAQQEKLQDATQQATQAAEQVRQLLRTNGIDPSAAQISRFATSAGL